MNKEKINELIQILKDTYEQNINCDYDDCEINIEFDNKQISANISYDPGDFNETATITTIWCLEINEEEPIWEGEEKLNFAVKNTYDAKEKKLDQEAKKAKWEEFKEQEEIKEQLDQELDDLNGEINWDENGELINEKI